MAWYENNSSFMFSFKFLTITSLFYYIFSPSENIILKFLERNRNNKKLILSKSRCQLIRRPKVELYISLTVNYSIGGGNYQGKWDVL